MNLSKRIYILLKTPLLVIGDLYKGVRSQVRVYEMQHQIKIEELNSRNKAKKISCLIIYIFFVMIKMQVTKREKATESEWRKWTWISEGDLFLRGAYFVASGDQSWTKKHPEVYDKIMAAPARFVEEMTRFAGALGCKVGLPC